MVFMVSKTSFFCTECMATVELINESFECDCQWTIYTPDEDGKPTIYDMPKGWINLSEALDCLALCQALFGNEWRVMIKAMPVIIAYNADEIGRKELESVLGSDLDIQGQIRLKAIAVGVKLARGEE